ncbi:Branched-chain amino acid transport protein (AzlD) [Serratia sp. FGI94]|uniref:AzlD domain-containing protein n=1 Tax=Serratia sp. FGI94 TaxID=671990 RepID=UPI0002A71C31|nr:AzlD domain-containing protein [Serratia sp. FGI94]AGB82848.1 Branched-chain amino acid transport protein (AzlD) [Serratia sp. FGI94]
MSLQSVVIGMIILAAGTYLLRLSGAMLGRKMSFSTATRDLLADAATTLLLAVAVIATLFEDQHFAGAARVVGVLTGLLLTWRKVPLIIVLIAAAAVTALLRWLGLP